MRGNVFYGLQLVRIIEGPDKRGLDNRGCTVPSLYMYRVCIMVCVHVYTQTYDLGYRTHSNATYDPI